MGKVLLRILCVIILVPMVLSVLYNWVNPVSTLMIARWVSGQPVERIWTPLKDISPVAIRTVVASEDSAFCTHWGIDIAEIRRMMQRADSLSDMRGTSTISMQVVKNLFLWQKPEIPRKLLEIPLTFWLDLVMSKERILEIYLNIAEWGPEGQFGIAAGAKKAFSVPPERLSARQAALLAVMLPNPKHRRAEAPSTVVARLATRLQNRVVRAGPQAASCVTPNR
ncbi:biosynthetic peptidoglycan transglycosylase [Xanthobacter sp. TB0136]|uniref:biosynthetic peptidoglycan transglycosylase n=1 Tax=Xanthobacter sp. TB0136 TaxID=3459177 RepID=UPI00403A4250